LAQGHVVVGGAHARRSDVHAHLRRNGGQQPDAAGAFLEMDGGVLGPRLRMGCSAASQSVYAAGGGGVSSERRVARGRLRTVTRWRIAERGDIDVRFAASRVVLTQSQPPECLFIENLAKPQILRKNLT